MSRLSEMRIKVNEHIKDNDFFWLHNLKKDLGIIDQDSTDSVYASKVCLELYKQGVLMACERKGNNIQYIRV